jgi:hypothetical protein
MKHFRKRLHKLPVKKRLGHLRFKPGNRSCAAQNHHDNGQATALNTKLGMVRMRDVI